MPGDPTGVTPDGLNVAVWVTNGGSIAPRSSSHRTPAFTVSRSFTAQLSPTQTDHVGRGLSIVQSPKFWSNRWTSEPRPDPSHRLGSFDASAGRRRPARHRVQGDERAELRRR